MNRIYHHYKKLEENKFRMWRVTLREETSTLEKAAAEFMSDTNNFAHFMRRVITEWPHSVEHNLSDLSCNRRAWLGHAATCLATTAPEHITRSAWWTLTQEQRDNADAAAQTIIELWELRQCQSENLELPF